MKIYVRRRHIERGQLEHPLKCPIALAFKAVWGVRPTVERDSLWVGGKWFNLPLKARRFIARFDAGKPVKPFAFVLRVNGL